MTTGEPAANLDAVSIRSETDAAVFSSIHNACFSEPWDAAAFTRLLAMPGAFGLVAHEANAERGMILVRIAGDECEVITLAVLVGARGRGIAGALVDQAAARAADLGAVRQVLEVGAANQSALRLYDRLGFEQCGARPGYYRDGDALIYARPIAPVR